MLCVHRNTITRWVEAGRLRSIEMPGGSRKFRRTDIEAILAGDDVGAGRASAA